MVCSSVLSRSHVVLTTCRPARRQLQGLALQGQLPASLGQLTALQTLNLGSNALSGPLPVGWGSGGGLQNLSFVDISRNGLTGALPSQWGSPGQFPALSQLSLDTNLLDGQLPSSWGAAGMPSVELDQALPSSTHCPVCRQLRTLPTCSCGDCQLAGPLGGAG